MSDFREQFARAQRSLPGQSTIAGLREAAFERFSASGLPGRNHENWRYTDLGRIRDAGYALRGGESRDEQTELVRRELAGSRLLADSPQMIFVDGIFSAELSEPVDNLGYQVAPINEQWDEIAPALEPGDGMEGHPLALLNTAFTEHGLLVQVPDDQQVEQPLTIVFAGSGESAIAYQPRVLVRLGERSTLTIVLHYFDCADAESWTNVVTQINQASNSMLRLYELQEHRRKQAHTELLQVDLGRDAQFEGGFIDVGGQLTRRDLDIRLIETGASASLSGVFLALDGNHVDNHISVDHIAAESRSRELFRGIAGGGGRGVFNGKVLVRPNAQRIAAHQRNDNLLLDATAEIDTKPELEIYADDVKCSHGATVGELDEQHLFYLQSRGIDAQAARALLTFAFANNVLDEIDNETLRRALSVRVAERLPAHERWEQLG